MKTRDGIAGPACRMSDLMRVMLETGVTGWVAVGLDHGWHDGIVYSTREGAEAAQREPSTYVRIPEILHFGQFLDCPVLFDECADYLRFADALRDVAPRRTPIVLAKAGGLIGTPAVKWGADIRKVTRRPGKRPRHTTVSSAAMWRDLVLLLPGDNRMASTDGTSVYLSIREPYQFPCEISYTPTGADVPGHSTGN